MNDLKPFINLKNLQKCVGFLFFNLFGVCAIACNVLQLTEGGFLVNIVCAAFC
jgi:hypothetical protein